MGFNREPQSGHGDEQQDGNADSEQNVEKVHGFGTPATSRSLANPPSISDPSADIPNPTHHVEVFGPKWSNA